jgi:ABC-type lipoprotein export system ATPase subunit
LLNLENVTREFEGPSETVKALDGVSLSVGAGEFVAVEGPSGCGKTTLLLTAGGLLRPSAGEVVVDGKTLGRLSPDGRSRLRAEAIGFVFQQFHLVPYLSVFENILAPSLAVSHAEAVERAHALIAHFQLEHRMHHTPAALSTGERQRTALARALLHRPRLLLADEPTGNLDETNAGIVMGYLVEFARNGGAVLLVTHDRRAAQSATRSLRMENGRLAPEQ